MKETQEIGTVEAVLSQVRTLALCTNTVLIAAMETLSDTAWRVDHKDKGHFKMSLKACREQESEGDLHSLIIKLLGSDVAKKVNTSIEAWKKALKKSEARSDKKAKQNAGHDQWPTGPMPPMAMWLYEI